MICAMTTTYKTKIINNSQSFSSNYSTSFSSTTTTTIMDTNCGSGDSDETKETLMMVEGIMNKSTTPEQKPENNDKELTTMLMTTQSQLSQIFRKKIVIVGDGCSGKTCLLMSCFYNNNNNNVHSERQKAHQHFFDHYIPTVFETDVTNFEYDGKQIQLALWDTAGTDDFDRLRPMSYLKCDVIIMCFSVDSLISMQNIIRKWVPEIRNYCSGVPVILIGTKKDLRDDVDPSNRSMVSYQQGCMLAEKIEALGYLECSAKTREGIREVFEAVTRAAFMPLDHKNQSKNGKKNKKKLDRQRSVCNII